MACRTCRFGVFFDGTGNSLGIDGDARSNIAKLYESYLTGEVKENFIVGKHYEVGIGTYMNKQEYELHSVQRKIDKGYGGGGAKRIYRAIDAVCDFLDDKAFGDKKDQYKVRTIDVFGFSRGAALARDFVNEFIRHYINKRPPYKDIRFNFIGLFDTVGSFGVAGNDINMKPSSAAYAKELSEADGFGEHTGTELIRKKRIFPTVAEADAFAAQKRQQGWEILYNNRGTVIYAQHENVLFAPYNFNLKQGANASAKHIVHFVAHDEKRYNFPLTNIAGSGGVECLMMGVHSDVGGGYPKSMTQTLSFELPYGDLEARAKAKAQGWQEEKVSYFYGAPTSIKMTKYRVVTNDLAVVYWHLMTDIATRYDVHLKPPSESIAPELVSYYEASKKSLINAYQDANTPEGTRLKERYVHYSSVDIADVDTHSDGNVDIEDLWREDSPDLIGGNDMRYVDTVSGRRIDARAHPAFPKERLSPKREIFANHPAKAVKPV
jgi:hypothetical protein